MASAKLIIEIWTTKRGKLPADDSDLAEMLAPHMERVAKLCGDGFQGGEIIDEKFSGWWKLERT